MNTFSELQIVSTLGVGFTLGLRHALDTDHLVAVTTIVSERKGIWSSSLIGAAWGLGHTAALLVAGLLMIAFHIRIPESAAALLESVVALMLIGLGINVLVKVSRGDTLHMHAHKHHDHIHRHPHVHSGGADQSHPQDGHHHLIRAGTKPFFVGMIHGLAGSAALMLVVLATISSPLVSLVYIALFGLGSVGGMVLMSVVIGAPFALASGHGRLHRNIRTASGILSIMFGLFYAYQIGVSEKLFS